MIKKAPTPFQTAAIVLFVMTCFGLLMYLWLSFGGPTPLKPKGYRAYVAIPEAAQLAHQADVRISGVNVGRAIELTPTNNNRTRVEMEINPEFAPIPRDSRAMLRIKGVLGETYIELTPGTRASGTLPDGGSLPDSQVSPSVEIDEILSTFDKKTRAAWRTWQVSQSLAARGRGADINAALGALPEFSDAADQLLASLETQTTATRKFIANTGQFFSELSARDGELRGLITDSNRFFQTVAARNESFADIWRQLPRFERESRVTLTRLTQFTDVAEPVIRQLQPAATAMGPAFTALHALAPEWRGFFGRLGPVVTASKRGLPAFQTVLRELPPLLGDFQPWLRNVNPIVAYVGTHDRELTSLFANVTSASLSRDVSLETTDQPVHYLRTGQTLSPLGLAFYPRPLGSTRQNAYPAPGFFDQLSGGLPVLDASACANGDPAPPEEADPPALVPLVKAYAFRTDGRDVARPGCKAQGNYPGFTTVFPQLRAAP